MIVAAMLITLACLLVSALRALSVWAACRTPIGRVNFEMARERERRRR